MPVKSVGVSAAFRQWTRGMSFMLAMGKTQVAALVVIAETHERDLEHHIGFRHRLINNWIAATRGLMDRGLVMHVPPPNPIPKGLKFSKCYPLTDAGAHVVALFKIAGIYDELVAEFDRADKQWMQALNRMRAF